MKIILLFFVAFVLTGCATKIQSVNAGFDNIEVVLDNPNNNTLYSLMESGSGSISTGRPDQAGKVYFQFNDFVLSNTDDYYIYLSNGSENIPFDNDKWRFRNPVWDKYASEYQPIIELNEKIEETNLAISDKEDGLNSSLSWLSNSDVFIDSECKMPTSTKVAGLVGNYAGDIAGSAAAGAVMGSIFPGAGTVAGAAIGFIGGLIGGEIVERAVTAKTEEKINKCETVLKFAQDCKQQIPTLKEINNNLNTELGLKSESVESNLNNIRSMKLPVDKFSAF